MKGLIGVFENRSIGDERLRRGMGQREVVTLSQRARIHSIDYYAYQSPLRNISPGFKCLFVVVVLLLCLWENDGAVSVFIIVTMAAANIFKNRVRPGEYMAFMSVPLVFVVLGCAAVAAEAGYENGAWFLRFTKENVRYSLSIMLRALACVSALYFLALSTPMGEIIGVLRSVRVPGLIRELMYLIYRYIFILLDTQVRMRVSAQSRLGYCDFRTSLKTFGCSMGSLLIISLKRAGEYYDAMESRCYDGELAFLEEKKKAGPWRCLAAVGYWAALAAIKVAVSL